MGSRLALMRLRLERDDNPDRAKNPEPVECDHEWDDVEPNPLAFRSVRVCVRCGVAAGHPEDDES